MMKSGDIKVQEMRGFKALRAFNAFNTLLLGLKMLPAYLAETYETFYGAFGERADAEKETLLREALAFVSLEREEVEALCAFALTSHGVPFTPAMVSKLSAEDIFEIIVAVSMEIGKIRISLVSESEKKNSKLSALISGPSTPNTLN